MLALIAAIAVLLLFAAVATDPALSLRWPAIAMVLFPIGLVWHGALSLPDAGVTYNEEHGWDPPQQAPFFDAMLPKRWQHEQQQARAAAHREKLRRRARG